MPRFGFVGPSYTVQSGALADSECINWFAETNEDGPPAVSGTQYGGTYSAALRSYLGTPGLAVFATFVNGPVRNSIRVNDLCFAVSDTQLYQVNSDGTVVNLGYVYTDGKAVSLAFNSLQLLIVSALHAFCYTITAGTWVANTVYELGTVIVDAAGHIQTVTVAGTSGGTEPAFSDTGGTITDGPTLVWQDGGLRLLEVTAQLAGAPVQCDCTDTYFMVMFYQSNKFQISQVLDGTTWPGQLVNEVSVFADNITGLMVNHRELWIFGNKRTQPYQDSGSTEVFDVIQGALIETGLAATFSLTRVDNSIFWIGQDERGALMAWRSNGYTPSRISTHAVEVWLSQQASIANLVAYSYQDRGHLFWVLYVPNSDCNWVFDVGENLWHKRAAWVNGVYQSHWSWNHSYCFGKHLVGDWNTGNLYAMSFDNLTDNGTNIRRLRRAPTITNEKEWIYHSQLTVDFQTGVGPQPPLLDGDGNPREPQAALRWSDSRGETWSSQHIRGLGFAGEYSKRVFWMRLGRSRNRIYELVVSDPVIANIVDSYLKTS